MHHYENGHPPSGDPQDPSGGPQDTSGAPHDPRGATEVAEDRDALDVEDFLDHGPHESSLTARVAFTTFALSLCLVLAVVAAFLVSDKSALRRADADLFGALADQSARAISAHVDTSLREGRRAADPVRAELGRLASARGVHRVALYLPGEEEPWTARARIGEGEGVELGPLRRIDGPARMLGRARLLVARAFPVQSRAGDEAVLVVEASYLSVERRMRDLVALSGRAIGLAALFLVFLVPLAARILLAPLLRVADAARTGDVLAIDDVMGGGEEVVSLAARMLRDAELVDRLEEAQEGIEVAAQTHSNRLREECSELKRVARSARSEARAAAAAKSAFVANTSHEVRTPLHAVIGTTDLLLETELDPEQRALAERSIRASRALLALVDDVLDLARFDAREIVFDHQPFDPGGLVEEIAELAAPLAAAKGLGTTSFVSPDVPERVVGDPTRVRQALMRLVDNAIKFTDSGEITVDVSWETSEEDMTPRAVFTVTDTGVGIGDDERARLFQAFEQLDASNTRRYGGVGLGLALVARIARAAGGEVRLESRSGFGSSFKLALPFERGAYGSQGAPTESDDDRPLQGARILLLDDAPIGAALIARTLTQFGARVTVETSTYAGFEAVLRNPQDVVVLDSLLPGRDAFLGALESNDERAPVPVALITPAHASRLPEDPSDDAISAVAARPLSRAQLVALVERALGRGEDPIPTTPVTPSGRRPETDETASNLLGSDVRRRVRILLVEDNETNQQLVQYVLGKRGYTVDVASNGRQAVDVFTLREYDAVLMDCQMPEMDGFEATRRLRALEESREGRTPILAMTASSLEGDRERCLAAGMDDMIAKPFQPQEMIAWVESWLVRSLYGEDGSGPRVPRKSRSEVMGELAKGSPELVTEVPDLSGLVDLPGMPPTPPGARRATSPGSPTETPSTTPSRADAGPEQDPRPDSPTKAGTEPDDAPRPSRKGPDKRGLRPTFADTLDELEGPEPPAPLPRKDKGSEDGDDADLAGALDRDVLSSLFDDEEGRQLASELIESFFELAPEHLAQMEAALEGDDLDRCASVAHKFVSTSGTVGAIRLAQLLREIEQCASRGDSELSARLVASCRVETDRARRALEGTIG